MAHLKRFFLSKEGNFVLCGDSCGNDRYGNKKEKPPRRYVNKGGNLLFSLPISKGDIKDYCTIN